MKNSDDAEELAASYQAFRTFRNIGYGLLVLGVGFGFYSWLEYSELSVVGVGLGAVLIWMGNKMKKDLDENGLPEKPSVFADENEDSQGLSKLCVANVEDEMMNLGLPKSIELHVYDNYILLVRRWFTWSSLVVLCMVVGGLAGTWVFFTDYSGEVTGASEFFLELLPWLFLLTGVFSIYSALAKVINKTHIYVSRDAIEIKQRPLPWPGNMRIEKKNIKQLYGREEVRNHNKGVHISYEVHVITDEEKDIALLRGLTASSQALYLEQEIEKYLGIKNRKIRGEIGAS